VKAARTDANHAETVKALRQAGIAARSTAMVGDGFPDVVAGFRGVNVLLEVKDGSKTPGNRPLTTAEAEFLASWPGPVFVVLSPEEAVRVVVECARERDPIDGTLA
jgi:hypothetical protein